MLSIIIPSRTEKFLNNTIQDVLKKSTGEIEVFPVLDGYSDDYPYEKIRDPRVKYISLPEPDNFERHKRQAVNAGVSLSKGEYVMWLDAHCVVAEGFDEVLKRDCQENWVVIPRRHRLDVRKWDRLEPDERPPTDYEYWMWRKLIKKRMANYRWDSRTNARKDIMIDDTLTCQGSFIFMTRKWFDRMGFMKVQGYTGWGQEAEEICLETWKNGGRVVVNKNTWYAHLRKGQIHGRMYKWTNPQPSYDYSFDYWVLKNRAFFTNIINRFMPVPNFESDWEEKLYGNTSVHQK